MGTQGYRADYRSAFESANDHLAQIYDEYRQLQLRKESLEEVLSALEPFLKTARQPLREIAQPLEPMHVEPQPLQQVFAEPARPAARIEQPTEPIPSTVYTPVEETTTDPLQLRINRALGLAVA